MKRAALGALLLAALPLLAAGPGKASGEFVVNRAARKLTHAYVVEKNSLLRIILATSPLDEKQRFNTTALQESVGDDLSALVIQLDEDREADTTYFFDPNLPAGLEVRQTGRFKPSRSNERSLSGRVVMDDDGFSFSYDATFEAPIVVQLQTVEPLPADATPADHALWRLKQMEIPYDESHFRSVVMDGNADAVNLFLTAGMPVTTANALHEAVSGGKTEVVKLLLERGADKNGQDPYGQSHVMVAASGHHTDVVKLLIDAGADINAPNQYRITPLAVAAEQGHLDIVKLLIAARVKINARDTAGGTALSVAILRGYQELVATLLEAGADVQRDKDDLLAMAADKPEIKAMIEKALKKK